MRKRSRIRLIMWSKRKVISKIKSISISN